MVGETDFGSIYFFSRESKILNLSRDSLFSGSIFHFGRQRVVEIAEVTSELADG